MYCIKNVCVRGNTAIRKKEYIYIYIYIQIDRQIIDSISIYVYSTYTYIGLYAIFHPFISPVRLLFAYAYVHLCMLIYILMNLYSYFCTYFFGLKYLVVIACFFQYFQIYMSITFSVTFLVSKPLSIHIIIFVLLPLACMH